MRMKKTISIVLSLLLLLFASACSFGGGAGQNGTSGTASGTVTDGTAEADATVTLSTAEKSAWTVCLANGLSDTALSATTALLDAFRSAEAKAPTRVWDNASDYRETECEILIGNTNRSETAEVRETLSDGEIRIGFRGTKLVILAANDWLLAKAIELLPTLWTAKNGTVTVPKTLSLVTDRYASEGLPLLGADGSAALRVVYPMDMDSSTAVAVRDAGRALGRTLGCGALTVVTDAAQESDGIGEILVGGTNRAVSTQALSAIEGMEGYHLFRSGNRIVLVASSVTEYRAGLAALEEAFAQAVKGAVVGKPILEPDFEIRNLSGVLAEAWYLEVPKPAGAKILSTYADGRSCMTQVTGANRAAFDGYLGDLTASGLTVRSTSTQGENRYALLENDLTTVWVEFFAKNGILRVYLEKHGTYRYPEVGEAGTDHPYETVLWQLPVDNLGAKENGGMSYVFRLGDGTFFVIDGGYYTADEADNLYRFLVSKTPSGKKTVISGWFISHLHWDHYGAMLAFSERYAAQVEVKAFYCHFTPPANVATAMGRWKNAARYTRLHTGMEWNLPGFSASVLYTHEDLLPDTAKSVNDQSTVLRVTVNGQRVLFLGDAQDVVSKWLLENQTRDVLSADLVQFSHHGYEGGTIALYDAIGAHTVLWPMNIIGNQENYATVPQNVFAFWVGMKPNDYPFANYHVVYEMPCVKKILIAGAGVAEIRFPYVPEGEKLPDYDAIYELLKKAYR